MPPHGLGFSGGCFMFRHRKSRPTVEGLESRLTLSQVSASQAVASILAAQAHPIKLEGSVHGTVSIRLLNPDVGGSFTITSHGTLKSLGTVSANGMAEGTGFIAQGRAEGSLTIRNSKGSFAVLLEGPIQPGFTGLPSNFQYTISGGTGAYKGATGIGTADVRTRLPVSSLPLLAAHQHPSGTSIPSRVIAV